MDTGTSDLWNVIEAKLIQRVGRVSGPDRYATAAAVSASAFGTGVPVAYVATGATFPDALAAGPAAGRAGGPVLLTQRTSLPATTIAELRRLKPARIVVVGSAGVVSDAVRDALVPLATSGSVTRVAGANRYETAAAVSRASFSPGVPVAYVATGATFADALPGGAAAGRQAGPILLTDGELLSRATRDELARLRPARIVVLGGPSVVSTFVYYQLVPYATGGSVQRLAGPDRYATAVAISRATTAPGPRVVYLATGATFPDGLAGTAPAVRDGGPLLLTGSASLPAAVAAEIARLDPARVVVLGSSGVVSGNVINQLRSILD
jgi:putative cell wall-binding protein